VLGRSYVPRHEIAAAVDGAAARAVTELARDRWRTATGESCLMLSIKHSVLVVAAGVYAKPAI
jgi:hypothetical protein